MYNTKNKHKKKKIYKNDMYLIPKLMSVNEKEELINNVEEFSMENEGAIYY